MPPKEEVAKEIGRVASNLTNDMQSAALKKARELGFGLTGGRLSLEETLINLKNIRDVLLEAAEKNKIALLPLKVQYTLYTQTLKVSDTLTTLVNGTDAVQVLEDVVDDLTSSAWQYNLHNLSGDVLGFQQKMNQLKSQELLIKNVQLEAKEFGASVERAENLLVEMEGLLTSAKEHCETINTNLEQTSARLARATEAEQVIAGLAIQAAQHDSAATRHEANANAAAATAQTIAEKLPGLKTEIEAAKDRIDEMQARIATLLSTFERESAAALADHQAKYNEARTKTESETIALRENITNQSEELTASAAKLHQGITNYLETFQDSHDKKLTANYDALDKAVRNTIEKLDIDFQAALKQQDTRHEEQRTNQQTEYNNLVSNLAGLEGQIRESILRATGYTLFHSFQKRQEALVSSKNRWALVLGAVVGTSFLLSLAFISYVNTVQQFGPAFYLKLSISLPIMYAIWFCSAQYSRERRLEEEYAFKSSISISLEPYRELVEKLVAKDKPEELAKYTAFIIESVRRVFTSPMERVFDQTKDSSPAESIIKATGDLTKDLVKLLKK